MQERFTHQLISDLSASAAAEIWEHSGYLISEEYLLCHGIRKELHQKASERIQDYAEQQLTCMPGKTKIHPQFAENLWPIVRRRINAHLDPNISIFFPEYCALLRAGSIRHLTVTPTVIDYFDHFCEALRHSKVERLTFPRKIAEKEGGIIKTLVLSTLGLVTVTCEDILSTILDALSAREMAELPSVEEYYVTDAYSLMPYVRLARWYQETALSTCITIQLPERADHRRFLEEKLQSRQQISSDDVDWILEQWYTGRKRKRDAENCPKCGQYDPRGRHYYRFIPGNGHFSCETKGRNNAHEKREPPVSDANSEESPPSAREPLVSLDDES